MAVSVHIYIHGSIDIYNLQRPHFHAAVIITRTIGVAIPERAHRS